MAKKTSPPKKMFGYRVHIQSYLDYSERSEEPYGSWGKRHSNTFDSIEKNDKYPDVVSPLDLTQKEGYLVWVEWSSGDSFGNNHRGHTEAIAIVKTQQTAEKLAHALKSWEDPSSKYSIYDKRSKQTFKFRTTDQTIELKSIPWHGYFESLDSVFIEKVSLPEE